MDLSNRVWYSFILALAVVLAYQLNRRQQYSLALSSQQKLWIYLAALTGAMVGAKLPFILDQGWVGILTGNAWLTDGKTILGGIWGAYLSVEITKWWNGISIRTGDTFALPAAVGILVGRWGCYIGGCCYGLPTTSGLGWRLGVPGDAPEVLRFPTQIYEMGFHAAAILWLVVADRFDWLTSQRLNLYLAAYCIYRFASEWLRPEPVIAWGLTAYQWCSLLLLLFLCWQMFRHRDEPIVRRSI